MTHAALAADEPVLDPELVIAGARHDVVALRILLAAAPFGVHRSGFDARDHPYAALRRTRESVGDFLAHGLASLHDPGADVIGGVLVIQRGQAVDIAGIEGPEPPADELERIGGHHVEVFYCSGLM